jgi:AraC-like DNA-binding protein
MSKQIPCVREGNKLIIDKNVGKGYISNEVLQKGLSLVTIDLEAYGNILYRRSIDERDSYYLILIGMSSGPTINYGGSKGIKIKEEDHLSAIMLSPLAESTLIVNEKEPVKILGVLVSRKWIFDNIVDEGYRELSHAIVNYKKPLLLREYLDLGNQQLAHNLINHNYAERIQKLSAVVTLLSHIKDGISRKVRGREFSKLYTSDIAKIIHVCGIIEKDWQNFPGIEILAREAKMGTSSFKTKFKGVTGKSPYQYYLNIKMLNARDLIINSSMTISEIGYYCGYKNLSHFARQFKERFNTLPSKVIRK